MQYLNTPVGMPPLSPEVIAPVTGSVVTIPWLYSTQKLSLVEKQFRISTL
jgi:hypothetical protein